MFEQLRQQFAVYGPNLLAGIAVLIIGWLVAVIASFLVRKVLEKVTVDNKIAQWMGGPGAKSSLPVERWVSRAVFYFILLLTVVAFLQTVKLTGMTEPLNNLVQPFMAYLPRLFGAVVLLLAAWVLATVLRKILLAVMGAAKVDEKLGQAANAPDKAGSFSKTFAEVIYWLVFLLFLPAILQALDMRSLLEPITALLNKVFAFLPNILSAAAILLIGWLVARIVQRILQSLLASAGADRLSDKWGLAGSLGPSKLSGVLGLIVYYLILIPVLISSLGALKLDAVTKPASDMLGKIVNALPNVVGAIIVVLLAVVIGRVVAGIVTNLLAGVGFNNLLVKLGLARQPAQGRQAPAALVGLFCLLAIVLFACSTAAQMLGFAVVASVLQDFITFAGHVLTGVLILGLGLLLAQLVARTLSTSDSPNARRLAFLARVVILALAGAMALRQTGLADEIVNLTFGLTLGAVAIAAALAFGLGGRDLAARTLSEWREGQLNRKP